MRKIIKNYLIRRDLRRLDWIRWMRGCGGMNNLTSIGLWVVKHITIPLCIIGLVLCWVWGRKRR